MQKWLIVVESNCTDSAREQEFNEWYNNTHLPDVLELPEVVRAVRFENVDPAEGRARYLALYEMETDDLESTLQKVRELVKEKKQQGRMSDLLQATRRDHFKQIFFMEK